MITKDKVGAMQASRPARFFRGVRPRIFGFWPFTDRQAITLGRLVEERDGARNNFDLIRLVAATLVLVSHAFPLSGDKSMGEPLRLWTNGQETFGGLAVCAFFFISGFLVTRSLTRSRSLITFTIARALRILPGLAVVVILAALVLGPLTTTLSLGDYFAHSGFAAYFRNIRLDMHYNLPGVFSRNALQAVNGSLWTLSFEVVMYMALPFVLWVAAFSSRLILPLFLLALIGAHQFELVSPASSIHYYYYVHLGQFFLAGVIAYMYRDVIKLSTPIALVCLCIVIASAVSGGFLLSRVIAGSYLLLWLAYVAPKAPEILTRHGDLSYGIYIYAFPAQQLVAETFAWGKAWQGNIALSLPLTFLLAYFSWRFVEAPSLSARGAVIAALLPWQTRIRNLPLAFVRSL
jgi:peptidoglycan/LPS O-acetylase OafA/YrhL